MNEPKRLGSNKPRKREENPAVLPWCGAVKERPRITREKYKGLPLDTAVTPEEAVVMYRVITGACRKGSKEFVAGLGQLKDTYTIRELIELTKGQRGAEKFAEFFGG